MTTNSTDSGFRILSINGGGIRGAFAAAFLAETERLTGKPIAEHFDLIVGTSTGGLIALAVALGKTPEQILCQYEQMGPRIFPPGRFARAATWLRGSFWPRYSSTRLAQSVKEMVGSATLLSDAKRPLVVPSFELLTGRPTCFKTRHAQDLVRDHLLPAWRVGMATAAAPAFFAPHEMPDGSLMIDGGVWANDPALIGTVEATSRLGARWEDIRVLSIGTAGSPKIVRSRRGGGFVQWGIVHGVHEVLVQASELGDSYKNRLILPAGAVTRVDEQPDRPIRLDDSRRIADLVALGRAAAKTHAEAMHNRFLQDAAPEWRPLPV